MKGRTMAQVAVTAEQAVADAIRNVTAKMQEAIEKGKRSSRLDSHDLIDAMLAVADELDPGQ